MKIWKRYFAGIILFIAMLILIFDAKTALIGAQNGLSLCIRVVIPSIFPFLFISVMLPGIMLGKSIPGLGFLQRLCGIPKGSESLFLLGLLGGYPVGASMIEEAYNKGFISKSSASRMLGFCSNAGPAFLFGMVSILFENQLVVWILWIIHIISALLVGMTLPNKTVECCTLAPANRIAISKALEISIKKMALICGWVTVFRVLLSVLDRWILWLLPQNVQVSIWGLVELSNGITALTEIPSNCARFILCSGMLAFAGLCVWMQTASVTEKLGTGLYFPGKVLQCLFSVLLSCIIQFLLFPAGETVHLPILFYIILISIIGSSIFFLRKKKSSSISGANIV